MEFEALSRPSRFMPSRALGELKEEVVVVVVVMVVIIRIVSVLNRMHTGDDYTTIEHKVVI